MTDQTSIGEQIARWAAGGGGFAAAWIAIQRLLNWVTGRIDRRQDNLDAQEDRVDREWQAIREDLDRKLAVMEVRFETVERKNDALRNAVHHLSGALIRLDPTNPALLIAEQALAAVFPMPKPEQRVPPSIADAAARAQQALDETD